MLLLICVGGDKIKSPYNSQFTKIYDYGNSRYRCANTQMTFRVTTNSVFHVSKLKYQKIFTIIREYYNGDTNTCKLAKLIHVTEKTAWTILYRIKYVSQDMTNEDKRDIISFTRKLLAFEKIKHIIVPSETETKKRTIKLKPKYKSDRRDKVDRQMSLRTREQAEAEYKQTRIEELRNGILLMLQSEMVEIPVEFIQEYNELLSKSC